jgi:hypothetical protein
MQDAEPNVIFSLILLAFGAWSVFTGSLSFNLGRSDGMPGQRRRISLRGPGARIAGFGVLMLGGGLLSGDVALIPNFQAITFGIATALIGLGLAIQLVSSLF